MIKIIRKCDLFLRALDQNPVRTSLDHKLVLVFLDCNFQWNLRMVIAAHPLLDLSVDPSPGKHRLRRSTASMAVVDIALPQDKFDQITDRYFYDTFFVLFNLFAHI